MAFLDMFKEVASYVPGGDVIQAQRYVNGAYRKIRDSREWSFLISETQLYSPAIITIGSITFTQFSNLATFDATGSAAVLSLSNPVITKRQIRAPGATPLYNIFAVNQTNPNAIVITLDRPYTESTTTGGYQLYRCIYEPTDLNSNPTNDFAYWLGVKVPAQGYTIAGPNLYRMAQELDVVDPQRSTQQNPYWVVSYKSDPNNNFRPLYEFWPHPTFSQGFPTLYRRIGTDLVNYTDILPNQLTERLVVDKAIVLLCEWAEANKGSRPELSKTDWVKLSARKELSFTEEFKSLKKQDNNTFVTNWIINPYRGGRYGPFDSNFMQSHDVSGWSWSW